MTLRRRIMPLDGIEVSIFFDEAEDRTVQIHGSYLADGKPYVLSRDQHDEIMIDLELLHRDLLRDDEAA